MSPGSGIVERVAELRRRVAGLVAAERAGDPDADDPFRGLYVTDQHVDRVLETPPPTYPTSAEDRAAGGRFADLGGLGGLDGLDGPGERRGFGDLGDVPDGDRLAQLARRARLTALDLDVLVAGLAPDVDPGFEKLYVYLNDDITRRRATTGLALRLAGASPAESGARGRLLGGAPLVDLALLEIDDADRPFLTRTLRVPDRVLQHLLGDARPPADIAALAVPVAAWPDPALVELLARGLADGYGFLHLHDPGDLGGVDLAHTVLSHLGLDMVGVDLARAPADGLDPVPIVREVVLRAAGLVVANADRAQPELLRGLVEGAAVVVTVGREPWDQGQSTRGPVQWRVEAPPVQTRRTLWRAALTDGWSGSAESAAPAAEPADAADGITVLDPTALDTLRLSPGAIRRSVTAARRLAAHYGQPLAIDHLREAARLQASSRLERLARRIRPGASWDDLIVHHDTGGDLELLVTRVRHREKVLDEWGLRRRSGHAEGIAALFAGDAGTGKTLAAEVLAGDLGLDLYVVDLSTVVDKYVGETEKNLERIFSEAEGVNGVLFFDEADALFGKRSEVSDARDRYANTEIAYLLQRIEHFDGVAVLATNLRANIDEAFLRRLAAVVDFPEPDAALRRRLWALHLQSVPDDGHVDLDFLAEAFALCGGNVRNVAVTAAYLAAAEDRPVAMTDLVRGVALEYRKLGRLRDESEFGPWIEEVA